MIDIQVAGMMRRTATQYANFDGSFPYVTAKVCAVANDGEFLFEVSVIATAPEVRQTLLALGHGDCVSNEGGIILRSHMQVHHVRQWYDRIKNHRAVNKYERRMTERERQETLEFIERILPYMETGINYDDACIALWHELKRESHIG